MVKPISIEAYMSQHSHCLTIDVRSPGEYMHAHVPSAYSCPLFDDAERAVIGTKYKQVSRQDAIKQGVEYFGPKMRPIIEQVEKWLESSPSKEVVVYCWRGGMRSGAVAWLLDIYGFDVYQIVGGYKSFRTYVLESFSQKIRLQIIGGYTGTGKTDLLHQLMEKGNQVIDLEGLAHHKGSAYGHIGQPKQPSQEMFENKICIALAKIDPHKTTWLEQENRRIGQVAIPNGLFHQMDMAPLYFIEESFEERLNIIEADYGSMSVQDLVDATLRIEKRLGGLQTKNVVTLLQSNQHREAFAILLDYYDRYYQKSSFTNKEREVISISKSNFIQSYVR